MNPRPPRGAGTTGDGRGALLDQLGAAICAGALPPGTVLSADELCARHRVARSVVREALQVLGALGLVTATRGVGTITQPLEAWNLLDPQVIAWRLRGPQRLTHLAELAELRLGVEPEAAALAAGHRDDEAVSRLIRHGGELWKAGRQGDTEEFLRLDVEFHALVLQASGNPVFTPFVPIVRALLLGRAEYGLSEFHPTDQALERHMTVLRAIQTGDADRARTESRALIVESLAESRRLWRQRPGTD